MLGLPQVCMLKLSWRMLLMWSLIMFTVFRVREFYFLFLFIGIAGKIIDTHVQGACKNDRNGRDNKYDLYIHIITMIN